VKIWSRRNYLVQAGCAALLALIGAGEVHAADAYPSRPIRIIVGYSPGGNTDIPARLFATIMAQNLGAPVVVENRPGASGVPAAEYVKRSLPDGYTLLWATSASHSVSVVALAPLPYDPVKDFTPITLISQDPNVFVSGPEVKIEGVRPMLDYLKAHPDSTVGNSGPATSGRFAVELMKPKLGIEISSVPYKSTGPLLTELSAGQIPFGIMGASTAVPFLNDRRIKAHFVTSLKRSKILPDVPTLNETVSPGFEAVAWSALYAPPGTPGPIVATINAAMREASQAPQVKQWLDQSGLEVPLGTPEELTTFMQADIAKWVSVAKENNLSFKGD
jgi:tripartite-type tricarboxylate transporter receptor subunit TctC